MKSERIRTMEIKDKIFALKADGYEFSGVMKDAFDFVCEKQLMDPPLWAKFVDVVKAESGH